MNKTNKLKLLSTLIIIITTTLTTVAESKTDKYLRRAKKYENKQNYKKAANNYKRLSELYETKTAQAAAIGHAATCYYKAEKYQESFAEYLNLINNYSMKINFDDAINRIRNIAEKVARGEGEFLSIKNRALAIEIYRYILKNAGASNNAPQDTFRLINLLEEEKEPDVAIALCQDYLKNFPNANKKGLVRLKLCQLLLKKSEKSHGDIQISYRINLHLNEFFANNPNHPNLELAKNLRMVNNEHCAEKILALGKFYLAKSHRRIPAAKRYFNEVITDYPKTSSAITARIQLQKLPQFTQDVVASKTMPKNSDTPSVSATIPSPTSTIIPPAKTQKQTQINDNPQKWLRPLDHLNIKNESK